MKLSSMFPATDQQASKVKSTALVAVDEPCETDTADWVIKIDGVPVTSSLRVANVFGKTHKYVLEAIGNLMNDMYPVVEENLVAEFSAAKCFRETTYKNRGKLYKMYYLTEDGFSLLAMGFTGKRALLYKMLYIARFNEYKERDKSAQFASSEMATIMAQAMTAMLPCITSAVTEAITGALPAILKAAWESQPQAATPPQRVADARLATLPDTLTVKQVREYLSIGFDRSYDLFHSADFPAYTIGRNLFVEKAEFIQWLNTTSKHGIFIG